MDEAQRTFSPNLRAITDVLENRVYTVLKRKGEPMSPKEIFTAIDGSDLRMGIIYNSDHTVHKYLPTWSGSAEATGVAF